MNEDEILSKKLSFRYRIFEPNLFSMFCLPRIHLFEWSERSWWPARWRTYMRDIRAELSKRLKLYDPLIPYLRACLENEGSMEITDLERANGTTWRSIQDKLSSVGCETRVHSDHDEPTGLRVSLSSFHDHDSTEAREILLGFQNRGEHVLIVEGRLRKWRYFIPALLSPIAVLILTPLVMPFRFDRILFTYFIPIIPLAILWDEIIGVLRTYDIQDVGKMLFDSMDEKYFWEMSSLGGGISGLSYIYGRPEKK